MEIRAARGSDAAAIRSIYAPIVRDTPISFEEEVPGIQEIEQRISNSIVWLVCEVEGSVVGYAYAGPFHPRAAYRWSAEVSLYSAQGHQRNHLHSSLARLPPPVCNGTFSVWSTPTIIVLPASQHAARSRVLQDPSRVAARI
jgi:hypothetical protein